MRSGSLTRSVRRRPSMRPIHGQALRRGLEVAGRTRIHSSLRSMVMATQGTVVAGGLQRRQWCRQSKDGLAAKR